MRHDILKVIEDANDVSNAVILTHNIDFIFVQSLVVPALRKCGSPALTIFADAHCAELDYQKHASALNTLGLRYRVVPIAMKNGFRFHPKALFLSGTKKATLLVGSGNLNIGGWRQNGEIWFRYDTDTDGSGPHAAFRDYLRDVVTLSAHPGNFVMREIEEAFDPTTRSWAAEMAQASTLLGRAGQGQSMLTRMRAVLGERSAEHLLVCTPYFDEDAEALKTVAKEFDVSHCTLMVQSGRTNLLASAADGLGFGFTVKAATFEHSKKAGAEMDKLPREAFLHAKFYAVQCESEVIVFAGSANCSRAALTIPGTQGNAELMTWVTLSSDEYSTAVLSELVENDLAPKLVTELPVLPVTDAEEFIHIHAARMTAGLIDVVFECSSGTTIERALVDQTPLKPKELGPGWMRFQTTQAQPLTICLIGRCNDTDIHSPLHWIDNERFLGITARGRSLSESINDIGRSRAWDFGAWTEILSELYKHLEYMPKGMAKHQPSHSPDSGKDHTLKEFTRTDVFSADYGLPLHSFLPIQSVGVNVQASGLRSLLLRWFGIDGLEPDEGVGSTGNATPSEPVGPAEEEPTDGPTPLPDVPPVPLPASTTQRKQALKLVEQVAGWFGNPSKLTERTPQMLAADLRITAVLFRVALGNGWLTDEEFFSTTLKIWLPLFYSATEGYNVGWIELLHLTGSSPEEFAGFMSSVELSAALASWALSTPALATSADHARFSLASALSVARLPWLWQTGGVQEIAKQVADVFAYASGNADPNWSQIEKQWLTLIRRGYALSQLERMVSDMKIPDISRRVSQPKVYAGELLWQGPLGFCVASADCDRTKTDRCAVLMLQHLDAPKFFHGDMLVPLAGLLSNEVFKDTRFSADARKEIAAMVQALRPGLQKLRK